MTSRVAAGRGDPEPAGRVAQRVVDLEDDLAVAPHGRAVERGGHVEQADPERVDSLVTRTTNGSTSAQASGSSTAAWSHRTESLRSRSARQPPQPQVGLRGERHEVRHLDRAVAVLAIARVDRRRSRPARRRRPGAPRRGASGPGRRRSRRRRSGRSRRTPAARRSRGCARGSLPNTSPRSATPRGARAAPRDPSSSAARSAKRALVSTSTVRWKAAGPKPNRP